MQAVVGKNVFYAGSHIMSGSAGGEKKEKLNKYNKSPLHRASGGRTWRRVECSNWQSYYANSGEFEVRI
jgi:phage gpG-like protein